MKEAVSGIYKITCIVTKEAYIGKTEGIIVNRIMTHLNGRTPGCRKLHAAIRKYGKENFEWEVLDQNVIPEILPELEKFYIAKFNTVAPHGFNLTWGGETGHHSEETIQKRTETLRANPPMLGKKHTPESCAKMSESRTGSKRTLETRRRQSESAEGHEVTKETREKISEANTHPENSDVHKFYLSLPPEMSLRDKTEIISTNFPNVKRKTINYWMSDWDSHKTTAFIKKEAYKTFISLPISLTLQEKTKLLKDQYSTDVHEGTITRWVRKWKSDVPHASPPKEKAHDLYLSFTPNMTLTEKLEILYRKVPNVHRGTIQRWVKKWSEVNLSLNTRPEYHEAYELFLSLPADMSAPEIRHFLREKFPNTPKYIISTWVRKWSGIETSRNTPRHSDYERAHKYFLSLPSDIPLNKKTNLFREHFPNVSKASVNKWVKAWTGETMPTGAPSNPNRPQIREYFLSLPLNMPISEKRKSILEKFGNTVRRSLVNSWTRQWHIELTGSPPPVEKWYREPQNHWKKGKPAHNRRPEYDEAREFFLSLPPMMPSREKSRQLFVKYPHIPKGTIYQWTSRWQSSLGTRT